MKIQSKKLNYIFFLKLLFIPLLYELVIGGSGHFFEIGNITTRMLFYFIAIFLSLIYYSVKKVFKKDILYILIVFTLNCILSSIIGYINHSSFLNILEDFKPLSFVYIILFFTLVIKNLEDIQNIGKIFKAGSLILAIFYITFIFLIYFEKINFLDFYYQQYDIGEIMFRNDLLFFYKGFLYLCIGFIFFLVSKKNILLTLFLYCSIFLTLTRGFILFTTLILFIYILFISKNIFLKIAFYIISLISIYFIPTLIETLGDKSDSDSIRFLQIDQVLSALNLHSFFVGHGFGIGVPIRPVHMELSFLEIFHKQGILGVFFWICIFTYIFFMFYNLRSTKFREVALPFILSVLFVVLQSTTNPYMNNPIGLTVILISIVVLSKLNELQKNSIE